ncbi:glycosyltransferase family 2 protein, partial [Acinetobacter nosocomialis]
MQSNYGFVVPVYNHPHYFADLISYLDSFHLPIVLVNDGSDD